MQNNNNPKPRLLFAHHQSAESVQRVFLSFLDAFCPTTFIRFKINNDDQKAKQIK